NVDGRVILYADNLTDSLEYAIGETNRRREKQEAYNARHGITPTSIKREISDVLQSVYESDYMTVDTDVSGDTHLIGHNLQKHLDDLKTRMRAAAGDLEFEEAARLRDEVRRLEATELGLHKSGVSQKAANAAGWSGRFKQHQRKKKKRQKRA
ncbi:MAG: UvrB/UvrC motif-containing protein, partial [Rhodospirillales bacterium]